MYLYPQVSYAHVQGVSIFKINGENTKIAPEDYSNPNAKFVLPSDSDIASRNYAPNEMLEFELDTTLFITAPSIFEKTNFIWDFGDGSLKQTVKNGVKNSHKYTKEGTYLLTVHADYTSAGFDSIPEPQILQATVITIGDGQLEIQKKSNTVPMVAAIIGGITGGIFTYWIITKLDKRKLKKK